MKQEFRILEEAASVKGIADVIIIGGGFAGVSAALAASRAGKTVILLEKSVVLGGLGTLGHVCIYLPLDDGLGHRWICRRDAVYLHYIQL